MLGEADAGPCPLCGEMHPEPQFGFRHGGPRECPNVVLGSFPVLDQPDDGEGILAFPRTSAAHRIREFETPIRISLIASPPPRPDEVDSRPRGLGVPWLRPPDLGEVL